jgi:hypothetical protein
VCGCATVVCARYCFTSTCQRWVHGVNSTVQLCLVPGPGRANHGGSRIVASAQEDQCVGVRRSTPLPLRSSTLCTSPQCDWVVEATAAWTALSATVQSVCDASLSAQVFGGARTLVRRTRLRCSRHARVSGAPTYLGARLTLAVLSSQLSSARGWYGPARL